jgi:hypothetical protein
MLKLRFLNGKLKESSSYEELSSARFSELELFDQHFNFSELLTPRYFLAIQNPDVKLRLNDNLQISYVVDNRKILQDEKSFWLVLEKDNNVELRLLLNGNKKKESLIRLHYAIYVKPKISSTFRLQIINLASTKLELWIALRLAKQSSTNIHINIYNNYNLKGRLLLSQSLSLGSSSRVQNYAYLEHSVSLELQEELLLLGGSGNTSSISSSFSFARGQGKVSFKPRILSLESQASLQTSYRYLYPSGIRFEYFPKIETLTEKAKVWERLEAGH